MSEGPWAEKDAAGERSPQGTAFTTPTRSYGDQCTERTPIFESSHGAAASRAPARLARASARDEQDPDRLAEVADQRHVVDASLRDGRDPGVRGDEDERVEVRDVVEHADALFV